MRRAVRSEQTAQDQDATHVGRPLGLGSRLSVVLDFFSFEALASLRLPVSLRSFQYAVVIGACAAATAVSAVSWIGLRLVTMAHESQPGVLASVVLLAAFLNLYAGLAYLLAELVTRRRYRLVNSPNIALFRALDIEASDVFAVYALLPSTTYFLVLVLLDLSLIGTLFPTLGFGAAEGLSLLGIPTACHLLTIGCQARAAATPPRPRSLTGRAAAGAALLLVAVGYVSGRWVLVPLAQGQFAAPGRVAEVGRLLLATALLSVLAMLVGLILGIPALRQLRQRSYAISVPRSASAPLSRWLAVCLAQLNPPLPAILAKEWLSSWAATLFRRSAVGVAALICLVGGVRLSGAYLRPAGELREAAIFSVDLAAFFLVMGIAEGTLHHVGVVTLGSHLRAAWELGLDSRSMARSLVASYLAPVVVVSLLIVALSLLIFEQVYFSPLAVAVAVLAASVVAECVVPPVRYPDGTTAPDAISALVTVAASTPALALAYGDGRLSTIAAWAYAVGLVRGALACVTRRIVVHPSSFMR